MINLILILATTNLDLFIDGLSNVDLYVNEANQEVSFIIDRKDIFFFYQKLSNLKFTIFNKGSLIKNVKNGFQIPKGSVVKVNGKWNELLKKYENTYLIGFFNGQDCDIIFYSSSAKQLFPFSFFPNQRRCVYHFYKNSSASNDKQNHTKKGSFFLNFFNPESFHQENLEVNGIIKVTRNKLNILDDDVEIIENDYDFRINDNNISFVLSIIFIIIGLLLYLTCVYLFGTDESCCSKILNDIRDIKKDDKENKFYSQII